jgi:PTH2 family peptidyl-tRNA hydrolase
MTNITNIINVDDEYTMYIIVNNDLKMKEGKIASQVGHAVEMITEKLMNFIYESTQSKEFTINYMKYSKSGRKKIVLKGTQEQMEQFMKDDDCMHVVDAGRTQVAPNSLTAIAFIPSNKNKKRFECFKLL